MSRAWSSINTVIALRWLIHKHNHQPGPSCDFFTLQFDFFLCMTEPLNARGAAPSQLGGGRDIIKIIPISYGMISSYSSYDFVRL
jgi:hypothetical protein